MNRRESSKSETRRLILDAARTLLKEKSVDRCTMRAIAEKAGVSPASVIVHFKNKTSLLETTIFEDIDHTVRQAIVRLPKKGDLVTRLTFIPAAMFRFYAKNRDLYRTLLSLTLLSSGENSPNLNRQMDEYLTFLTSMIEEEKTAGKIRSDVDTQIAAISIVSLYFGVLIGFFKDTAISPKIALTILSQMTHQYLAGIMTGGGGLTLLKNLHAMIEAWFAALTVFVFQRKYWTLAAVLFITACFISQIPKVTVDMRDEAFFHDDDPILLEYNQFRDTFGQDDIFIIGLKPEKGMTVEFIQTLVKLHRELESSVPYLHDISSLANGRIVRGQANSLIVEELIETPPENAAELETMLELVDHYPLFKGFLISEDKSMASIIIKAQAVLNSTDDDAIAGFDRNPLETPDHSRRYLSNDQNIEIYDAIREVTATYENKDIDFHFAGTPVFVAEITKGIAKDLKVMIPASFLMIILLLTLLFRRISGVVFPLLIVFSSLFSSVGLMAVMRIPVTTVIQILPTFLIVVGIGDSVHILAVFYKKFRASGDKQSAIVGAVGYAGLPVLMTSLTTAFGLLSFTFADVKSIEQLGYVASVGVMLAFFYTILLLPALISIFPIKKKVPLPAGKLPLSDRLFSLIAKITTRRPGFVMAVSGVVVIVAFHFALSLRFFHNAMTWFPEDSPIRVASDLIDETNGGSVMLEVTVDSGSEYGLYNPDLIQRLDRASVDIPGISVHGITAGSVRSIADILKETNRALNEDDPQAYVVPDNRELIAQELLLFESSGSDDLEDVSDSQYQIGRLSILAPFTDSIRYKDYVDKISEYLAGRFPSETVTLTGHICLFIQVTKHFITSMAKSYLFALVVITVLMLIMIGRVRVGLLSMAANVVPIILIFGLMGPLDIPLDMSTILVGSIVLGLVVDDTIHFLHHFRKAFDSTNDVEEAVRLTLFSTGRALVITSMALCAGFFIYMTSFLVANIRFGLLVGCAVIFALAADFLMIPALLSLVHRKGKMA